MRDRLDIEFLQLNYTVQSGIIDKVEKNILKNIHGEFQGRELSAIMGPSGGGKTTLLNILSGFTTKNVTGTIKVNGALKDDRTFRKYCAYIMQDDNIHLQLTVQESMKFSIQMKCGLAKNKLEQSDRISSVIKMLGLSDTMETFVEKLSGGQKKRLSIALELVDDPQIMFFDEPTTGLDSSSSTQCLSLMKKLAQSGKTIICTIHQPSALLFEMFDHLYALSDGRCIYQGSSKNLVPFLTELDLVCPESYNPSDYLLEIATNDYGPQNYRLTDKIRNGANYKYRSNLKKPIIYGGLEFRDDIHVLSKSLSFTNFSNEITNLLRRNFLIMWRDPTYVLIRFWIHVLVGLMIGLIYYRIGNNADYALSNFKGVFMIISFLMYTSYYSLMISFPLNLPIIRREHYNRWYSSEAYYLALSLTDLPLMFVCNLIYITLTYYMTEQPMESFRFLWFHAVAGLTSFVSQGLGLLLGSLYNIKGTLVLASVVIIWHINFAGIFVFMKDVHRAWHWLFELAFTKHAVEGLETLVLGYNRGKMECHSANYCHFSTPQKLITFVGFHENLTKVICSLIAFLFIFRIAAYISIRNRLKNF